MDQEIVNLSAEKWYVRTGDGAMYGPASPLELVGWAAEARIVPGCQVSRDGVTWAPAETIPRLRMEWTVEITPEEKIGPLHLLAIGDLVREGTIPLGAELICAARNVRTTIDHHFFALLLQEARENLGGAAEEEKRLLEQVHEQWIPSIRADAEARLKATEQSRLAEQTQWKQLELSWQAEQAQWKAEQAQWKVEQARWKAEQTQWKANEQDRLTELARCKAGEQYWQAEEVQWKAVQKTWQAEKAQWLAEQAQWKEAEQSWSAEQLQWQAALEEARENSRILEEAQTAVQARLEGRANAAENECRRLTLQWEQERAEFSQVRQELIAELDKNKSRLDQLETAQEEALRSLDQFRATQGVERQKIADLARRYQEDTTALQQARDAALQSSALLAASLESADQERAGLRGELELARGRETSLRVELSDRKAKEEAQLRGVDQAHAETEAQTRIADELREQLAQQTQSSTRLAAALAQKQHLSVDLTPGPIDTVLLDESALLEQECAHLAELLDKLPSMTPAPAAAPTASSSPISVIDWMDPRPAPSQPMTAPQVVMSPVALRIQGAVKALRQAEKELAKQRQLYHDLIRSGADREAELTALVEQLKRDLEMSSRLVRQSMAEMEKREGELRQLRRAGAGGQSTAPTARNPVAPIEPEVLPPVTPENPPKKLAKDVPKREPNPVLAGLEKQARADLHNWQKQRAKAEPGAIGRIKKWISSD
jgi:hypothetical protein